MGRELRRKQAKKEGKSLQRELPKEENEIKKLIIITLILVVIITIIYLISALFMTKELDWFKNDKQEIQINDASTILASEAFKQKEEEYYVYFYDFNEEDADITSTINSKLSSAKIYKVNTGSALNAKYVSDESNKKAKTLSDLKVKASTIIKVSGEEITAYYENEEITEKLK